MRGGGGYGGGMGVQSTRWGGGCYVFWVFFDYCDCVLVILYYYLIDSNYEQRRSCMLLGCEIYNHLMEDILTP